jgi:RNA polymerase sigma-70 factor (ECF subfamily)
MTPSRAEAADESGDRQQVPLRDEAARHQKRVDRRREHREERHVPDALPIEFARNFRGAYRTLWTIAAGIVNDPFIAEDVVQEAAVTALGKLHEFEPNSNFTAWMAKIVRYIALNQFRRTKRQPTNLDPGAMDDSLASRAAGDAAHKPPLVDQFGQLDLNRTPFDDRVMNALKSVSDIARACLLLRTIQGLSYDEIANVLQIPPGTSMSHVHRTRIVLRERLAEMDPTAREHSRDHSKDQPKGGGSDV